MKRRWAPVLLLVLSPALACAGPLPQPLTLEQALEFARSGHPQTRLQLAESESAEAERAAAAARTGFDARILADGRLVEPTDNDADISSNDSRIELILSKPLYDFGHTRARVAAAEARVDSEALNLESVYRRRRIAIMRAYFDVLLADLEYATANEAMAIQYVRLDRLRDRNALGQASDVALAEQQVRYERGRAARYKAESQQRLARGRLAEALGRPGELSSELAPPELAGLDREPPELDELIRLALAENPAMQGLRARAEADRLRIQAARATGRPVLTGELTAADYAREFATRDRYRARLLLDVPLYTGGRVGARQAEALAGLHATEAKIAQKESELRETLREAVEQLVLLRVEREGAGAEQAFRDLDLDRARAEYEHEFAADLGNAMADQTAARLRSLRADYELALTWARIAAITGRPEWDPVPGTTY
jgi:outer membrane protein TolC